MERTSTPQALLDLKNAAGKTSVSRRELMKLAGAAAVATGVWTMLPNGQRVFAQADQNVIIYGSGQDISNLDPHTGHDYSITWGQRATYDSLLRFEENPPVVKPLVAKEVVGSDDATTWTITLDERAVFPDGTAIDAEVVKWNFARLLELGLGVAWMFSDVMTADSITIVDAQTLEIALTKPFAPFDLILPWLFIAQPSIVEENAGDDSGQTYLLENAAGSGPYSITRWEPGSIYEFTRREDYWYTDGGASKPVDRLIWRIIRESSTKRIAIEAGEVQYGDNFSVEDIEGLAAIESLVINDTPSYTPFAIKLNNQAGPTADLNVRKALLAALDYDAVLGAANGRGTLMVGPLPPQFSPWHKEDLEVQRFDLEAAKSFLAQSEYPDGFDLEYVYVTGLDIEEQVGLILLEKLAELNINLTLTPLVWPDLVARAADPATAPGMFAVFNSTNYMDPDNFLWQSYHSSMVGNWSNASEYANEEIDALLEQGRGTVDPDERKTIYDDIQQKLVDQAVEIWLYCETANVAWVKELGDLPVKDNSDIRLLEYTV